MSWENICVTSDKEERFPKASAQFCCSCPARCRLNVSWPDSVIQSLSGIDPVLEVAPVANNPYEVENAKTLKKWLTGGTCVRYVCPLVLSARVMGVFSPVFDRPKGC